MNAFGALLTGVVAVVLLVTKFMEGAYIVVGAVPVLVALFYWVRRHYLQVAQVLEPQSGEDLRGAGSGGGRRSPTPRWWSSSPR